MRHFLLFSLLMALSACGDPTTIAEGDPPDTEPAATETPPPGAALTGTPPDGSLGSLTLRIAESDADDAPFSEVASHLPAPVPEDAIPMVDLDGAPSYHVRLDEASLPDGFERKGTHFIYLKERADGTLDKARLLRGWVGLSDNHAGGSYTGRVGGFTLPPFWRDGTEAPRLTFDTMGDDSRQIATAPLAVVVQPAWALPITLPPTVEDPAVTAELDIEAEQLSELGVQLHLIYPGEVDMFGETSWDMADFRHDRSRARERRDDPAAPATIPYVVYPDDLGDGPTEAYLIAFRTGG